MKNNCSTISAFQRDKELNLESHKKERGKIRKDERLSESGIRNYGRKGKRGQRKFWKYEEFEMFYW